MGAPGWDGAVRQPTLPEEERAERAETRGDSDGAGVLVERVKRSGWEASEAGRHDMCARTDDALRARTVLAYNMKDGLPRRACLKGMVGGARRKKVVGT